MKEDRAISIAEHGATGPVVPAIRLVGVERYFGAHLNLENPSPRLVRRLILRLLGFNVDLGGTDGIVRAPTMIGGRVLQGITLDIEPGACVCVTGASGSGKSVLLRLLSGSLPPTAGRIEIRGRVSALHGIGDNLDPELTALENVEMQRRLKGVPSSEAAAYATEVIAFAELEGFEQVKVRQFSTGMVMRLSIALALQGRPSILLIDDVLGVGDLSFQAKCVEAMHRLSATGMTIVMVSGDDELVGQIASRVITLSGGRIAADRPAGLPAPAGGPIGAVDATWRVSEHLPGSDVIDLLAIMVRKTDAGGLVYVLEFLCNAKRAPQRCRPLIDVMRGRVMVFRSLLPEYQEVKAAGPIRFTVTVPVEELTSGTYDVQFAVISIRDDSIYSFKAKGVLSLDVTGGSDDRMPTVLVLPRPDWAMEVLADAEALYGASV